MSPHLVIVVAEDVGRLGMLRLPGPFAALQHVATPVGAA